MATSYGSQVTPLVTGRFAYDNGSSLLDVLPIACGTFVATGSAVTVANAAVTASSQILITLKTAGGTVSAQFVQTITPGTGFTVIGGGSDTSTYNYAILG